MSFKNFISVFSSLGSVLIINAQPEAFITIWKMDNSGTSYISCITMPTIVIGYNSKFDREKDRFNDQSKIKQLNMNFINLNY